MSDVFEGISSSIEAFTYRCLNDAHYTMQEMQGAVERITGHRANDLLGNATTSFADLTADEDKVRVIA